MYFSIPVSDREQVTDTPVGVKSIRSFFFVDRRGRAQLYGSASRTVTISIDGKDVCKDLFVLPFMTNQPKGEASFFAPFDSRNICVKCLKNVDMSEIKISACENLDMDIVFECSDVAVEEEKCEFFECKELKYEDILKEEVQLFTEEESEKIFVYSGVLRGNKIVNVNSVGFNGTDTYYYGVSTYTHQSEYDIDLNYSISTSEEVMPNNMPISMLSPSGGKSWKEVQYKFDKKMSKQPRFKFDRRRNLYAYNFFVVVMLSYDKPLK